MTPTPPSRPSSIPPASHQELSAFKALVHVSLGFSRDSSPVAPRPVATSPIIPQLSTPPLPTSTSTSNSAAKFNPNASLILIGMRGVGKTTLGLILATYLNRPFIDCDRLFERLITVPVREFIAENGWEAFRDKEAAILDQVLKSQGEGKVIVLGGGVVERESNRKLLIDWAKTKGPIIHVCRQLEDVFFYLKSKQTKSTWGVFEEEYKTLWERRVSWYQACSNRTFVMVSSTNIDRPSLSLKPVEALVHRLVSSVYDFPIPFRPLEFSWNSPRTVSLLLTGSDTALHDSEVLEIVSRGADALELQIDTFIHDHPSNLALPSHSTPASLPGSRSTSPPLVAPAPLMEPPPLPFSSHLQSSRHKPGTPKFFQVALTVGFLRQESTLPIIYTVRTTSQGGKFSGSTADYIQLVKQGFRLISDFVDIELCLSDHEIRDLIAFKGKGSRVILSWTWTDPEFAGLHWTSDEVHKIYARAVRLGADIVKISKPASSIAANFELAELQATLAAQGSVPLIGVNSGRAGQLGRLCSSILTSITHPLLTRKVEGEISYKDLQLGRRLAGLEAPRVVYDLEERSPHASTTTIELFNAATSAIGLNVELYSPQSGFPSSYDAVFQSPNFGGALVSLSTSSAPPSTHLSHAASNTGFADVALAPPHPPTSLFSPSLSSSSTPPLPPNIFLENLNVKAINKCITSHLSPANANPKTALVAGAKNDRLSRELFCALNDLGIRRVFTIDCSIEVLELFVAGRLSSAEVIVLMEDGPVTPVAEVVRLKTLDEIQRYVVPGRPPTIVVSWSESLVGTAGTSLPKVFAESSTGGIFLVLEEGGEETGGVGVSKEEEGWIRLTRKYVRDALLAEQFRAITGKDLPVFRESGTVEVE